MEHFKSQSFEWNLNAFGDVVRVDGIRAESVPMARRSEIPLNWDHRLSAEGLNGEIMLMEVIMLAVILENVSRRDLNRCGLISWSMRFASLVDEWKVVASLLDGNRSCFLTVSFDYEHGARSNWPLFWLFITGRGLMADRRKIPQEPAVPLSKAHRLAKQKSNSARNSMKISWIAQ